MSAPPPGKQRFNSMRELAMAMELPFELVATVGIGAVAGHFLDRALHTEPWLAIVLGLAGFGIGIWDVIRRLSRDEK